MSSPNVTAERAVVEREVEVTRKEVRSEHVVVLRLPLDVALTLRGLMASVGGSDTTSYRLHTSAIADALSNAGVCCGWDRFSGTIRATRLEDNDHV